MENPIDWAYEVVILLGAITIGFSIPQTTLNKGHVLMEFFTGRLPQGWQKLFNALTRFLGIAIFTVFGWRIFSYGDNLSKSGEVSPVLHMPTYPVAYGIGVCCFVVCLVLFYQFWEKMKGVKA